MSKPLIGHIYTYFRSSVPGLSHTAHSFPCFYLRIPYTFSVPLLLVHYLTLPRSLYSDWSSSNETSLVPPLTKVFFLWQSPLFTVALQFLWFLTPRRVRKLCPSATHSNYFGRSHLTTVVSGLMSLLYATDQPLPTSTEKTFMSRFTPLSISVISYFPLTHFHPPQYIYAL